MTYQHRICEELQHHLVGGAHTGDGCLFPFQWAASTADVEVRAVEALLRNIFPGPEFEA